MAVFIDLFSGKFGRFKQRIGDKLHYESNPVEFTHVELKEEFIARHNSQDYSVMLCKQCNWNTNFNPDPTSIYMIPVNDLEEITNHSKIHGRSFNVCDYKIRTVYKQEFVLVPGLVPKEIRYNVYKKKVKVKKQERWHKRILQSFNSYLVDLSSIPPVVYPGESELLSWFQLEHLIYNINDPCPCFYDDSRNRFRQTSGYFFEEELEYA